MPRDASHLWKLFVVEMIHLKTGRVHRLLGPYSEKEASKVNRVLDEILPLPGGMPLYATTRRATPEELKRFSIE